MDAIAAIAQILNAEVKNGVADQTYFAAQLCIAILSPSLDAAKLECYGAVKASYATISRKSGNNIRGI